MKIDMLFKLLKTSMENIIKDIKLNTENNLKSQLKMEIKIIEDITRKEMENKEAN